MGAFLLLNLLALFFLFMFLFRPKFGAIKLPSWVIFAAIIGIYLWHRSLLLHGERYRKIISEFSTEGIEAERRGDLLFGWYLVLSLLAVVGAGMLLAVRLGFGA
jgi:hypothetical protein